MTIGSNIKKLRTGKGLTQDQLGERLFVTRQTVSNWERGTSQPDLAQLEAIAGALDTDVMTLLYGRRSPYRPSRRQVGAALGMLLLVLVLWALCWQLGPWCSARMKEVGSLVPYFSYYYYVNLIAVLGGVAVVTLARLRWELTLGRRGQWLCRGIGLLLLVFLLVGPFCWAPYFQQWVGKLLLGLYWGYERGVTMIQALLSGVLLCLGWSAAKPRALPTADDAASKHRETR